MVLEMAGGWFDNFKVDDKSYVFFCSELVSLCTQLLILERHSPKGMKWPIAAHVAHGTAVPAVPQLSPHFSPAFFPGILEPVKSPLTLRIHKNTP